MEQCIYLASPVLFSPLLMGFPLGFTIRRFFREASVGCLWPTLIYPFLFNEVLLSRVVYLFNVMNDNN